MVNYGLKLFLKLRMKIGNCGLGSISLWWGSWNQNHYNIL